MLERRIRGMSGAVLLVLFISALPVLVQAGSLYFVPATGSFDCGETYTLDLMIDDTITDLRGASLVLEFDEAILAPLTVSAGSLVAGAGCPHFFTWLNASAVGDSIAVDISTLGCSVDGPGSILHMTFEGFQQGVSFVRCRSGVLRDSNNQDIPYVCDEAAVDYRCPVEDQIRTWGAAKAIYR